VEKSACGYTADLHSFNLSTFTILPAAEVSKLKLLEEAVIM